MVPIIKTIVFNIVAEGSHKKSQGIEIVELGELRQSLRIHNEMAMLGDIWAVKVVVVLHRPLILIVNLDDKLKKLIAIDNMIQIILLKQSYCHERHLQLTTDDLGEIEKIEIEGVDGLIIILVRINQVLHHTDSELKVNFVVLQKLLLLKIVQFLPEHLRLVP